MNLEAINTLFSIEKENGYEGGINDYVQNLKSNPEFLQSAYQTSVDNGYEDSINDFAELVGFDSQDIKKKNSDLNLPSEDGLSSLDSTPTTNEGLNTSVPISSDLDLNQSQIQAIQEVPLPEQSVSEQPAVANYEIPRTEVKKFETFGKALDKGISQTAETIHETTLDKLAGKPALKQMIVQDKRELADKKITINGIPISESLVYTDEDKKKEEESLNKKLDIYTIPNMKNPKDYELPYYTTETELSGKLGKDILGGEFNKAEWNARAQQWVDEGKAEFVMDYVNEEGKKKGIQMPKVEDDTFVIKPTEKGLIDFNKQIDERNAEVSKQIEEENVSIGRQYIDRKEHPLEMPTTALQDIAANYYTATGKLLDENERNKLNNPEYLKDIQYQIEASARVKASDGKLNFQEEYNKAKEDNNKPDEFYGKIGSDLAGTNLWGIKETTQLRKNMEKSSTYYVDNTPITDPKELKHLGYIFKNPESNEAISFGKWWYLEGSKHYGNGSYLRESVKNMPDRRNMMRSYLNWRNKDVDVLNDANVDQIINNKKRVREALEKGDVTLANELIDKRMLLNENQKYIDSESEKNKATSLYIESLYPSLKEIDVNNANFEAKVMSKEPLPYALDLGVQGMYGVINALRNTATGVGVVLNSVIGSKNIDEYLRYQNDYKIDQLGPREKQVSTEVKDYSDAKGNKYEEIGGKLFRVKDGTYEYIQNPDYKNIEFKGERRINELGGTINAGTNFVTTVATAEITGNVVLKPVTMGLSYIVRGAEAIDGFRKFNTIIDNVATEFGVPKDLVKSSWTYENAVARARLAESAIGDSNITKGLRKYAEFLVSPRNANATGFFFQGLNHDYNYALENGLEDRKSAALYAYGKGIINYALMLANPSEKIFGTIGNESRTMVNALLNKDVDGWKIALGNVLDNAFNSAKHAGTFATEMQGFHIANKAVDKLFDNITNSHLYKKEETNFDDLVISDLVVPFTVSFIGGMKGTFAKPKEFAEMNKYEIYTELAKDKDIIKKLNEHVENRMFFPESRKVAREAINKISEIQRNIYKTPDADLHSNMALYNTSELLTARDKKKSELESVAEPFRPKIKDEITEIERKINNILDQDLADQNKKEGREEVVNEKMTTTIDLNAKKGEDVYKITKEDLTKPTEENAIQEQTTNESVLGAEQPKVELQGVGEGNAKPEQVTEQKETITPEGKEEVKVEVEPEFEKGDYEKVSKLAEDIINGVADKESPENIQLMQNYPKLIEKEIADRQKEEESVSKQISETKEEVPKENFEEINFEKLNPEQKRTKKQEAVNTFREKAKAGKEKAAKETDSPRDKKLAEEFTSMNTDLFSDPKDAMESAKVLENYISTGDTSRMEALVFKLKGEEGVRELAKKGIKAKIIKIRGSETLGRFSAEQQYTDINFFKKLFNGDSSGREARKASGVTDIGTGLAKATKEVNNIVDDYVNKFKKTKPNGEAFNTLNNNIERGIIGEILTRPESAKTPEEIQNDFDKTKEKIYTTIKVLEYGDKYHRELANSVKNIYDKILKDSKNAEEVLSKSDINNVNAVNHWIDIYKKYYPEFERHNIVMRGKELGKYENYTPRRVFNRKGEPVKNLGNEYDESPFFSNSGLNESEAKSFRERSNEPLPLNSYLDLNFDMKNANALKDMLVDLKTTGHIKQAQAFLNSTELSKLFPKSENGKPRGEEIELLNNKVKDIIDSVKKSTRFDYSEFKKFEEKTEKLSNQGTRLVLTSFKQPFIQTIPMAVNTWVNGANPHLDILWNQDKLNFINNSGYKISNRGLHSQADIKHINRLLDLAAQSKGEEYIGYLKQLQDAYLKYFLEKPDVYIAKASWLGYYEKSLRDQAKKGEIKKEDATNIDYSNHKINEKAAEYADEMVDSKQNTSMREFQGRVHLNKTEGAKIARRMFLGLANFRMNSYVNLGVSESILFDKNSSKEDKIAALRSISGWLVERALYGAIQIGVTKLFNKDKELSDLAKYQVTNAYTDIVSPVPMLDPIIQGATYYGANFAQKLMGVKKEDRFNISEPYPTDLFNILGVYGITLKKGSELFQLVDLASTGTYEKDGEERHISIEDQNFLKKIIFLKAATTTGILPADVDRYVNSVVSSAKKGKGSPEEQAMKEEKESLTEEEKGFKKNALDKLVIKYSNSPKYKKIVQDELIRMGDPNSEEARKLEEIDNEKSIKEYNLLYDPKKEIHYKTKDDMKRYNRELYNKNFGTSSEYHKEKALESKINKEVNRMIKMQKNKKYGFEEDYALGSGSSGRSRRSRRSRR